MPDACCPCPLSLARFLHHLPEVRLVEHSRVETVMRSHSSPACAAPVVIKPAAQCAPAFGAHLELDGCIELVPARSAPAPAVFDHFQFNGLAGGAWPRKKHRAIVQAADARPDKRSHWCQKGGAPEGQSDAAPSSPHRTSRRVNSFSTSWMMDAEQNLISAMSWSIRGDVASEVSSVSAWAMACRAR